MKLNESISRHNFRSFIWHILFFSLAINFMDFDTVIPAMMLKSGGSAFQIGLLTAILMGGAKLAQLLASPFLFYKKRKKPWLILGITIRFTALFAIATSFFFSDRLHDGSLIFLIFFFISFFSLSEALATLSYTDILGKSMWQEKRKRFFSLRQVIASILIFSSAFLVKWILEQKSFPDNYATLFLFAGVSLALASLGFWRLKEVSVEGHSGSTGLVSFFRLLWKELSHNRVLQSYLVIINTLGIGMGILPFMILYARENIGIDPGQVGNFVIMKTIGLVISGLLLFRFSNRIGYRMILVIAIIVGSLVPVYGLIFADSAFFFPVSFLLGGIYITFFNISRAGVLLEISTNENRILYAGIAGVGNILITLFPLLAGFVIDVFGFTVFFLMISVTILVSSFFISSLRCK